MIIFILSQGHIKSMSWERRFTLVLTALSTVTSVAMEGYFHHYPHKKPNYTLWWPYKLALYIFGSYSYWVTVRWEVRTELEDMVLLERARCLHQPRGFDTHPNHSLDLLHQLSRLHRTPPLSASLSFLRGIAIGKKFRYPLFLLPESHRCNTNIVYMTSNGSTLVHWRFMRY